MSTHKTCSSLINDAPVPQLGQGILVETLELMLKDEIIGTSSGVRVVNPSESQYFLDFFTPENDPFIKQNPQVGRMFFVIGVSTVTGRMLPGKGFGFSNGDHFILVILDIYQQAIQVIDSLPTKAVMDYVESSLSNMAMSVYGDKSLSFIVHNKLCTRQVEGSNDCAVHAWKNLCNELSFFHEIPAFLGLAYDPDDVCRDVFRAIFYHFYQ